VFSPLFGGSRAESGHTWTDQVGEQVQDLAVLSMAADVDLAVELLAVHDHFEGAGRSHDEPKLVNHVLIVGEKVAGRAHGAIGIVSGNAVGDVDSMTHNGKAIGHPRSWAAERWAVAGRLWS
jgi:hypothetical protein